MADLATLQAWRDALEAARYSGVREVIYGDRRVNYATDAELRQALADVNRQINTLAGTAIGMIKVSSSKGLS